MRAHQVGGEPVLQPVMQLLPAPPRPPRSTKKRKLMRMGGVDAAKLLESEGWLQQKGRLHPTRRTLL